MCQLGSKTSNSKLISIRFHTEPFVEECQNQLHSHYNTFSKVKIIPWERASAIHIDDIYTALSWVKDYRKASGVTQEELEDYTDIFKGDKHHPNPKRLLVYGRPGIGKSTFSQKTAFDWSNQRKGVLMKFDVVLLIKLRDVCGLKDIHDVLRASKLLSGDEVCSVDDVYEYILRNQEKVLLILDGYDEYCCKTSGEESLVRDIWEGKLLRDVHVIITTRQEKTDELRWSSHVQFEINGFKRDGQVRAFASKFLRDQDVEEFLRYLQEKQLKEIAEIPLLLSMLCFVWNQKPLRELLKSRADIYKQFLKTLLHHAVSKDSKPKQSRKIDDYKEELCRLGKLAFNALLEDNLSFPISKLPDSILMMKLTEVGLFHVLNVSSLDPEQAVHFIHKSVQEFLAAFYLKEQLKETSTTCLSQVDSFGKIVKMIEVLRFACELSADAACTILSHLGFVGKKEGLTEYNFTEAPCIEDLSNDQLQFLTLISHTFFSSSTEKRRDLYSMFLSYIGGILLIDSDQLHSIANEHFLKSAEAPELIFFPSGLCTEQSYQDLSSVLEDLSAVFVCCSGEKKASDFFKKYSLRDVSDVFLKNEGKIYVYIATIQPATFPTEMLRELISSPESTQKKKPVDDHSNEQDDRIALCLTENSTVDTQATRHCLSYVWKISVYVLERQEVETLIDVLSFVTSPRGIDITGFRRGPDPVLVDTLVSRINFTNRLQILALDNINLTAKPAAVIARSLYQAPNLSRLNLSCNPLGEGVSDLSRHLSCAAHLETLDLLGVKMTKKQVNDLTEAVGQTKIRELLSSYHVSFVIFLPFVSTVYRNTEYC